MILPILLAFAATPACIASVHDGDTVRLCDGERVRIADIDAPELAGSERCIRRRAGKNPSWCDRDLAIQSRDALRAYLASGEVTIVRFRKDAYGRTLGLLKVNGHDAGYWLRRQGLARRWVE